MATYNCKIRIPGFLDRLVIAPLLLCRWLWYGYTFRRIPLNMGKYSCVDPYRFGELSRYDWSAKRDAANSTAYKAVRYVPEGNVPIYMHRQILNAEKGQIVDHKNRDGFDNRVANLRFATYSQNASNRPKFKCKSKASSGYIGVSFEKSKGRWTARICVNEKRYLLGRFGSELEAAKAYDAGAKKYHGEFACLNFPEDEGKGLKNLVFTIFNFLFNKRIETND